MFKGRPSLHYLNLAFSISLILDLFSDISLSDKPGGSLRNESAGSNRSGVCHASNLFALISLSHIPCLF